MGAPRSVGHAGNAQRYQQLRERLARTSITESSRDGVVRVTVSAGGLVTDLVLRDDRHPRPLPEIAAQVSDCVRRAQARIPGGRRPGDPRA